MKAGFTMNLESALTFSHTLVAPIIKSGDTVVDATVGNGNDTVFLASRVGKTGHVLGFDVQKEAIEHTKLQLQLTGFTDRVQLILDGHEHLSEYLSSEISAAIFNLGYLPGSDKQIITLSKTTLPALETCLHYLRRGGIVALVVYYGHPGGVTEKDAVLNFASNLDQQQYQVLKYQFINQVHEPPFLLAIQKR